MKLFALSGFQVEKAPPSSVPFAQLPQVEGLPILVTKLVETDGESVAPVPFWAIDYDDYIARLSDGVVFAYTEFDIDLSECRPMAVGEQLHIRRVE